MNSGEIFVTFVIPAVLVASCYLAMVANERSVRRDARKPPAE